MSSDEATLAAAPRLRLAGAQRAAIEAWAAAGYPAETCGLLIGSADSTGVVVAEVRDARNVERNRTVDRYVLDPGAIHAADGDARRRGLEIVGFWHSHPDSPAIPSETDRIRAWPGYDYVIVSVEAGRATDLRVWRLTDGSFDEGRVTA